jgi:hypothetical protein
MTLLLSAAAVGLAWVALAVLGPVIRTRDPDMGKGTALILLVGLLATPLLAPRVAPGQGQEWVFVVVDALIRRIDQSGGASPWLFDAIGRGYLAGLGLSLLPLTGSILATVRLARSGRDITQEALAAAGLHASADIPRGFRVRESDYTAAPCVAGLFRPTALLPTDWRDVPGHVLAAALAHEAAHVRCMDVWLRVLARTVRCVYWFFPVAWLLSRRMEELSEEAADLRVVEAFGRRHDYARALLFWSAHQRGPTMPRWVWPPGVAYGDRLEKRVQSIIARPVRTGGRSRWARRLMWAGALTAVAVSYATIGGTYCAFQAGAVEEGGSTTQPSTPHSPTHREGP